MHEVKLCLIIHFGKGYKEVPSCRMLLETASPGVRLLAVPLIELYREVRGNLPTLLS